MQFDRNLDGGVSRNSSNGGDGVGGGVGHYDRRLDTATMHALLCQEAVAIPFHSFSQRKRKKHLF